MQEGAGAYIISLVRISARGAFNRQVILPAELHDRVAYCVADACAPVTAI